MDNVIILDHVYCTLLWHSVNDPSLIVYLHVKDYHFSAEALVGLQVSRIIKTELFKACLCSSVDKVRIRWVDIE